MKEIIIPKETKLELGDKEVVLEAGDRIKIMEGYQGWTNWETWVVNLWMDNDGTTDYFGSNVDERTKARDLGKEIQEYYEDEAESVLGRNAGLFSDIITNVFNEVNWTEIAEGIIDGYR